MEDDDGILTDEEVVVPKMEVRVPSDWQSKIAAKALSVATALPLDDLLTACAESIETHVLTHSAVTLPMHVWERLHDQHGGSHKATEQALAALINGVEASWTEHITVQLFGELCGMLTAEHSPVVTHRVLSLLAEGASPHLVDTDEIASTLSADSGGYDAFVDVDDAISALTQLRLSPEALTGLEAQVKKLPASGASVLRLDAFLLSATLGVRAHAATSPPDVIEEEEGLRQQQQQLQAQAQPQELPEASAAVATDVAEVPVEAEDASPAEEEHSDAKLVAESASAPVEEVPADDAVEVENDDEDVFGYGLEDAAEEAARGADSYVDEFEEDEEEDTRAPDSAAPQTNELAIWSRLASGLPVGIDAAGTEARRQLFNRLDTDSDGMIALQELESELPKALQLPDASNIPMLQLLVSQAFEAAKNLAPSTVVVRDDQCSRDEFDGVVAYVHAACTIHAHLHTPPLSPGANTLNVPGLKELLRGVPAAWGIDVDEASAAFETMPGYGEGVLRAEDVLQWIATHAMAQLAPSPPPMEAARPPILTPPPHADSEGNSEEPRAEEAVDVHNEDAVEAEEEDVEEMEYALDDTDAPALIDNAGSMPPPPPGGLDPVFETTERSAFSTTGEWGNRNDSLSSADARAADGTLGGESGFGSVKKGFFDASNLALDDSPRDGDTNSEALRLRYEQTVAEMESTKQECERLKVALAEAKSAEAQRRATHRAHVQKMLDANEALQAQLKELNGVVERVVQNEIDRGSGSGGSGNARPPPVFPTKATPGTKGQRKQAPVGSKPFK